VGDASGLYDFVIERRCAAQQQRIRGVGVPAVLRSGDHARIARWRQLMSLWRTWERRPDLLETADLTPEEQKWTDGFRQGRTPADFLD